MKAVCFFGACMAAVCLGAGTAWAREAAPAYTALSLNGGQSSAAERPAGVLPPPVTEIPAGYREATAIFPAYQDGKRDYNAQIYETEPFQLHMALPKGWSVREPSDKTALSGSGFTPMEIYDGGRPIGSVGFNRYEVVAPTTTENYYRMIYNQLMLGSVINWDNDYTPVTMTETTCTATCRVMHKDTDPKWGSAANAPELFQPAILSYDEKRLAYVAMSFDDGSITDKQLQTVAKSIRFTEPA